MHFAENLILKKLHELQEYQIRTTATASITLKHRLKSLRKAFLKASQDQKGATLKYSLPCIEQLCKQHDCPDEYTRELLHCWEKRLSTQYILKQQEKFSGLFLVGYMD